MPEPTGTKEPEPVGRPGESQIHTQVEATRVEYGAMAAQAEQSAPETTPRR